MRDAQRNDYAALSPQFCIPFSRGLLDFQGVFGNSNPVVMEIGFGMGGATGEIAEKMPETNFLGIEVHTPGVARLLGDIRRKGLGNIRIIEHDALEVCAVMVPRESLAGVHLFFPDPWPKMKHHKRRLVTESRVALIRSLLAPGGYFYFITDWEEYARSSLEILTAAPDLRNPYPGFAPTQDWRPQTKFEGRGRKEERAIWELYFVKKGLGDYHTALRPSPAAEK
jgi:tRNA (guanine-N7-)-methyltransferase